MLYFDTSYLVRLYIEEHGADLVKKLAATSPIACSFHGAIECVAAFHRVYREKRLTRAEYIGVLDQFQDDDGAKAFSWLPFEKGQVPKLEKFYRKAPSTTFIRAADAIHLACARENGFKEIYSHDRRLLAAAPHFGLKARNVIK